MLKKTWPFLFSVPTDLVNHDSLKDAGITLKVLRLDKIHPVTGGNKWFKLLYNLDKVQQQGSTGVLTFGGAFSNHIAATAEACAEFGIPSIGIIRGEESAKSNNTLSRVLKNGMRLKFVDRNSYREFRNPETWSSLKDEFGDVFIIPEGGSNEEGIKGCELIADLIPEGTDHIFLPVGTGATMRGLLLGMNGKSIVTGIAVVNALDSLKDQFVEFHSDSWNLLDYSFGAYARKNSLLEEFVAKFNLEQEFSIEPLYTGRMFYAIFDLLGQGKLVPGNTIVAIHTGGRQYLSF